MAESGRTEPKTHKTGVATLGGPGRSPGRPTSLSADSLILDGQCVFDVCQDSAYPRPATNNKLGDANMLFCLTADYTPQALNAMRENPNTNRREAVTQLLEAAGGKLIDMYGISTNGPGAMVIFDVPDPAMARLSAAWLCHPQSSGRRCRSRFTVVSQTMI